MIVANFSVMSGDIEMKYRSTRGKVQATSFEDVLFSGFTSDGGLFMPEKVPLVDKCTLEKWKSLSYLELGREVLSLFIPQEEMPTKDLEGKVIKERKRTTALTCSNKLPVNVCDVKGA